MSQYNVQEHAICIAQSTVYYHMPVSRKHPQLYKHGHCNSKPFHIQMAERYLPEKNMSTTSDITMLTLLELAWIHSTLPRSPYFMGQEENEEICIFSAADTLFSYHVCLHSGVLPTWLWDATTPQFASSRHNLTRLAVADNTQRTLRAAQHHPTINVQWRWAVDILNCWSLHSLPCVAVYIHFFNT